MIRHDAPHRRGAAMLMVLVSMATAMTLVVGWLASQDNSALVASNATRAASARASAQCGLELAVALLQSEAPWQTAHQDGWVLQGYPLGEGVVDLRLIDETTGLAPDETTNLVRIESTARTDAMEQSASALATVHPFDEDSMADLSGYAAFASKSLAISGSSRIRSWGNSGTGQRVLGSAGSTSFSGRTRRDLESGDVCLHVDEAATWGSEHDFTGAALPTILGPMGLELVELPSLPDPVDPVEDDDETESQYGWPSGNSTWFGHNDWLDSFGFNGGWDDDSGTTLGHYETLNVQSDFDAGGDLHLNRSAVLRIEGEATIFVSGDLTMDRDSAIEVADTATLTIVVGGDVEIDRAVIGGPQSNPPWWGIWKAQHIDWIDPKRIRLVTAAGSGPTSWTISNRSLVQAVIEAPAAEIDLNRATILGRLAGDHLSIRRGARLYFDHHATSGQGLKAVARVVDRLDLMDLHPGGLDQFAREEMIARLETLLDRPRGTTATAPIDGWWMHRPFPVDSTMTRCGGDVTRWEDAVIASADTTGRGTP
ncbi:MAG: hypothetical protein QGG74_01605 [Phycisphaerales bacterium]|jgi:hypothetical protein|nr:hypothetical protein [Phycisphaerales bacterium]